jgi:hypothetical protein
MLGINSLFHDNCVIIIYGFVFFSTHLLNLDMFDHMFEVLLVKYEPLIEQPKMLF